MHHSDLSFLHSFLLILFFAIIIVYILRFTIFRSTIRRVCGSFDGSHELAHLACAALMVPMVISPLMVNATVRTGSIWLSLAAVVFFLVRWLLEKTRKWWNPVHAAMFLGTAVMFYTFDHFIVNAFFTTAVWWVSGLFYFLLSFYYGRKLVRANNNDNIELNDQRRLLLIPSELSHVIIGLAMLGMILWPMTFMVLH